MSDMRAAADATDTPEKHSPLQAVLPHVLKTFKREPALALTVAYLMVALAGIYFDYNYYQKGFGIPILSLAQIGDYLVAGLQQPVAIALVAATFPLCWLMDRFNVRSRRRDVVRRNHLRAQSRLTWLQAVRLRYLDWHLEQLWGLKIAYVLAIFLYGWVFVAVYARHRVNEVRNGGAAQVTVRLTGADLDFAPSRVQVWSYLGAVSNYVFLYDPARRQALVVPVNAIASLRPVPVARPAAASEPVAPTP